VRIELYEAGHMMYIRKADHAKLKRDLAAFIRQAAGM
jgi:carboxypeptidase C (cathepsin A)